VILQVGPAVEQLALVIAITLLLPERYDLPQRRLSLHVLGCLLQGLADVFIARDVVPVEYGSSPVA
jgi:hypothetical protein